MIWLILIVICIACIIGGERVNAENEQKAEEIKSHMVFNDSSNSITLLKRSKLSASILFFDNIRLIDYKYNEGKAIYRGTTIGNVAIGEVETRGPSYTERLGGSSGKWRIKVIGFGHLFELKEIILSPDLISQAQADDRVSKFLKGDKLELRHDIKISDSEVDTLRFAQAKGETTFNLFVQKYALRCELTYEECQDVTNWVKGI